MSTPESRKGIQTLGEIGLVIFGLAAAGFALVQGYLGLTGDRVPVLPYRAFRESSGVFVHWNEHPVWSAIAVACWFIVAALIIVFAIKWGFSDDKRASQLNDHRPPPQ